MLVHVFMLFSLVPLARAVGKVLDFSLHSRGVDWRFFGWFVSLIGMLVGVLGCPDCGACLFWWFCFGLMPLFLSY